MMRRLLISIAAVAGLSTSAFADLNYQQASPGDAVIFDFTCFTTKHCTAHVPINSAGTEIFNATTPGYVRVASGFVASGAYASGSIASGAMVDVGAQADSVCGSATGTCSLIALVKYLNSSVNGTGLVNPATSASWGLAATASALPGVAVQVGLSDNGTGCGGGPCMRAQTAANPSGTIRAGHVDIASIAATTIATSSGNLSAGVQRTTLATDSVAIPLWGHGTSGASVPTGIGYMGGRAQNAEATAVTNGQLAGVALDLVGKQIVLPYANPENILNGVPTAAITDTTSTQVLAAAGASVRNYVTWCAVQNSHATVGTFVQILDGVTAIDSGYAGPNGGGFARRYPTAQRGTANTALNCQATTTGANFKCVCGGYKGA